jgi:hypothetical protein
MFTFSFFFSAKKKRREGLAIGDWTLADLKSWKRGNILFLTFLGALFPKDTK